MNLEKSLVFFDVESTSVDVNKARICQFSAIKIDAVTGYQTEFDIYINPQVPMPAEATEVNHITDEMLKDCPTFDEVAQSILDFIGDSDLGGYNIIHYDVPVMIKEFERAGYTFSVVGRALVDAFKIFCNKNPRNLAAASLFYLNKPFEEGAHNSLEDTRVTLEVFKAQLEKYDDLPKTMQGIWEQLKGDNVDLQGKIKLNKEGIPCFTFGKYKDRPVKEVYTYDPSYIGWINKNEDFPADFKQTLFKCLK